jgi:CRP/FNR family cyclic AMP-dependent transcriptional regulator
VAIVALLGPGDIFGELALLDGQPRSATVQAVTEIRTHVLDRGAFLDFLSNHPDAALAVSAALAARLRQADERLAESIFLDLPTRLGRYILQMATSGGKEHPLEVTANQRQLAETVGASRQSVNRILGQWERLGLIRRRSRGLVLLQPERLRRLVF